ncbi:NfeD family protein [Lysinibacter cavernae]|uniref:Membrane protein implicated in regulation of membrane protease activity n=1 Tax=Lysinibacter cavernae TaxID=1640652 RepID=A0A7X5QZG7_9MICO|nr:NfeD family protein [Lysinibacter cavernae]NIH52781.1 membrane protein implicated in regulation of membrane protease activity [Lysinibacter cavernae]
MIEFVINHGWVAWLALALLFLVVEMLTLEFTGLMLATASLGGVVAGLTPMPFWAQVVLVAILALLLILFIRPPLLRWLKRDSDPTKSNVDALIGLSGTVISVIPQDGVGTVKLSNGDTWTASFAPGTLTALVPGQPIIVTQISGATAVVRPATTAEETL